MKYYLKHCQPNPTIEYCRSILEQIHPDTQEIVSQGGGSTIDIGKWVSKELGIKHTAIPTTAGTGSEVTKYCVLMVDGKKTTFTSEAYIPDNYILDPSLVTSLPELHTLSSGLDALSQAIEAGWSKNATEESNDYSITATTLALSNLQETLKHPEDKRLRMNMLIAANLSGRAINITKTNVCHAISYPLTEWYGIPHGIACALSLKYFSQFLMGDEIEQLLKTLPIPRYEIDAKRVANEVIKSPKLKDYPYPVNKQDIILALTA